MSLQQEVPLVPRPYQTIAERLAMEEQVVIDRVTALKAKRTPVIRQISAIFDSRSLGYAGSLVAARVDESRIQEAAAEISKHPGVSHNYRREHAYNLWYTRPRSRPTARLGLQRTVDILHQRSGAIATRLMPSLKLYKIVRAFQPRRRGRRGCIANRLAGIGVRFGQAGAGVISI